MLLLLGLLTTAKCIGIEIEEAYYKASIRVMEAWHIPNVSIMNKDVQATDLHQGDVFFMYSPFFGKVLNNVLAKLKHVAEEKTIRICSYGNSTLALADEPWLKLEQEKTLSPYCAATFASVVGQ